MAEDVRPANYNPGAFEEMLARLDAERQGRERAEKRVRELADRLDKISDQLVPVSGAIMQVSCGQEREHTETCDCYLCRAFVASQDCTTKLEEIVRELREAGNG